ncbi:helix-turn-helix domain-containing protein [Arthrobacter luteolus]|uniref:helix-turn-helix domain-containing protein n=1 Tax=Arthrobacter luteolus TaxID=98672 RepID=UPI0008361B32|nr:helix-turn-helix transcriptional regulator [Arthrobacter luteolus]
MDTYSNEAARNIAAVITRKDRSKKSVADAAGIPLTTFNRKINGHGDFGILELAAIADALQVHPTELLPAAFTQRVAAA